MSYKVPITSSSTIGSMKVGSGLSVLDGTVSVSLGTLNYGFFTAGTQTNPIANAINIISINTIGLVNGVSVLGGNALTVVNAGVYNTLFTINIAKTAGGTSSVSCWLRYNGVDIQGSRQELELTNTLAQISTTSNFTINMDAGSNIQMCWSSADTTVALVALLPAINPIRPSSYSTKIILTKIS